MHSTLFGILALGPQFALANVIVVPRDTEFAASGKTAGLRSLMLYDCDFDFLDSILSWSKVKRDYCCSQNKLLCATSIAGLPETVVNAGYDCDDGIEHWNEEWLVEKKLWCCAKKNKG